jgi:hypothetical protein
VLAAAAAVVPPVVALPVRLVGRCFILQDARQDVVRRRAAVLARASQVAEGQTDEPADGQQREKLQ